jgi:riboflavin kinase/FMN adenylyltransferase
VGFFDGVHLGHRHLIEQVRAEAVRTGTASLLITFTRHPQHILPHKQAPDLLTTQTERMALLQATGIDYLLPLPFTSKLAALSARSFMEIVIRNRCQARTLVVGYDHLFGHNRSETFTDYVRYGAELGIAVHRGEPFLRPAGDGCISSSYIRKLLQVGDVSTAAACLGRPYSLSGMVVEGRRQGRLLGFPTANLETAADKLIPANGVYAVQVCIGKELSSQNAHIGMLNIGHNPTLTTGRRRTIEVHLLDFSGNLYGETLHLHFIARLRDERKFASLPALQRQIEADRQATRHAVQAGSSEK